MVKPLRNLLDLHNQIMAALGYWGVTGVSLYGVAVLVVGWLSEIPWFWILTAAPIAAYFLVWAVIGVLKLVRAKPPKQASTAWNDVNEFMLFQAACLWAGVEPSYLLPTGEPYARFTMLKEAVRNRELIPFESLKNQAAIHFRQAGSINAKTFVRRSELQEFADKQGSKPSFLFPDK